MARSAPAKADSNPFNPADPAFIADPYPVFHALRSKAEIHDHPGLGLRVAVSHRTCSAILRDRRLRRLWSDAEPTTEFPEFNAMHRNNMLSNGNEHDRLRGALAHLFSRPRIRHIRSTVHDVVVEHIAQLRARIAADGSACFMRHVANPLPIAVITRMIGFPPEDSARLRTWSNAIVKMYEYGISDTARAAAEQAAGEFTDHIRDLLRFRRQHPSDDVLSELGKSVDRGESALTAEELIANYILLLMAGHEATVNSLGNSIAALHEHPDQWRLLRERADEASHFDTAADELLRFDTPNQLFERTAVAPVELAGQHIAPGEKIAVLLGAANRDPAIFDQPDQLDLTRTPNYHLAMGAGAHYCLGAPLARLELASMLAIMATELPQFELAAPPQRHPEFVIRGFSTLEITDRAI